MLIVLLVVDKKGAVVSLLTVGESYYQKFFYTKNMPKSILIL